ncbi:hypothetical protein VTK56DRAFT_8469 [Thermocarpiscus australiensis]
MQRSGLSNATVDPMTAELRKSCVSPRTTELLHDGLVVPGNPQRIGHPDRWLSLFIFAQPLCCWTGKAIDATLSASRPKLIELVLLTDQSAPEPSADDAIGFLHAPESLACRM